MDDRIPIRPYSRTLGSLDAFIARTEMHHIAYEAAPGAEVELRGWIIDQNHERVDAAWLAMADSFIPVTIDRERHDVARAWSMKDRTGSGTGFEHPLKLPADLAIGTHEVRIVARTQSGRGVYGETPQLIRIVHPRVEARPLSQTSDDRPLRIRIGDTEHRRHRFGSGSHELRQEASMRLTGSFEPKARLAVLAQALSGTLFAWEFDVPASGRFDAALWTGDLERGAYRLTIGPVDNSGAVAPIVRCAIGIAGPHHLPPLHFPSLISEPHGEILMFEDAGLRLEPEAPPFVAGRPIAIGGWCIDPVANEPALAVYIAIDDQRPLPLSHHLSAPPSISSDQLSGFGGVIDTTKLDPGEHRFRTLAAAVSGTGWYVVDDRTLPLARHG